jgi:SAM-dependent methyltransferase
MTRAEIQARFDRETASVYSQRDPIWLPDFKYMFSLVPELLQPHIRGEALVLDIGAGTGNLTRSVLEAFPNAKAVLVDFSPNMLSEVSNVLSGLEGRFRTMVADFMEMELGAEIYSAVVSSFAIHHCRDMGEYGRLYKRIAEAITPLGIFVCCDVVAGADANLTLQNESQWTCFLREQGLSQDERDRILANYHVEDSPIELWAHLRLLKEAGFGAVDVVWKKSNFAIYVGVK